MQLIHWKEWNAEAFIEAEKQKKPILLSISAVWCHWCHVMDHTTYGDERVAKLINESFIPVRIDTDKRPEINQRYNVGGWPTAAILTFKGNMVDATTYLPANNMIGFLSSGLYTFESIGKQFDEKFEEFYKQNKDLRKNSEISFKEAINEINQQAETSFDEEFGGFGFEPKFPIPELLQFLSSYYSFEKTPRTLKMLEKTLTILSRSGTYDSQEQGFFRYSTVRDWSVPHYEKMLEDNSQLIFIYLELFKKTGNDELKNAALNALDYLFNKLFDKEFNVFFGSQDADEEYYKLSLSERKSLKEPFIDKTIFTDWNALMVPALLNAYNITKEEKFKKIAFNNLQFILRKNFDGKNVFHYFDSEKDKSFQTSILKDYALLLQAIINCYEFSFEQAYLEKAEKLLRIIEEKFFDSENNAYNDVAQSDDAFGILQERKFNPTDNAIMIQNLLKLAFFLEKEELREKAIIVGETALSAISELNIYVASLVESLLLLENGLTEIKISGKKNEKTKELLEKAMQYWNHSTAINFIEANHEPIISYCFKKSCLPPMKSFEELKKAMQTNK
ncbi:MAG: DUF255 domain-containing protein [archaeon]|nr:DUF255 domain-containing protein [archaeon]